MIYDVMFIGGGPAGYSGAEKGRPRRLENGIV